MLCCVGGKKSPESHPVKEVALSATSQWGIREQEGMCSYWPHRLGIDQGGNVDPGKRDLISPNDCSRVRKTCTVLLYRVLWRLMVFSRSVRVFLDNDQPEAGVIEEMGGNYFSHGKGNPVCVVR